MSDVKIMVQTWTAKELGTILHKFEQELTTLINTHGIDNIAGVPDWQLASVIGEMIMPLADFASSVEERVSDPNGEGS